MLVILHVAHVFQLIFISTLLAIHRIKMWWASLLPWKPDFDHMCVCLSFDQYVLVRVTGEFRKQPSYLNMFDGFPNCHSSTYYA